MSARELITGHLDLWTGAVTTKSSSGRGSNGKVELTGVKKLRELILELAVRGQLVPQAPEDTSFRELVLQLREDHEPIKTRGRKTVSGEVSGDEKPFNIPKTWVWTRLGEIVDVLDHQRKPITKAARKSGPYPYYGASGIVDYVDGYLFDESLVLVGEDGAKWDKGEGTAFSISGKTWVNNHAHVLRPRREAVTDDYLVYFLTAADLNPYITGMTVPKLNQARLSSIPVATPNLEEQHRIVQKVDELMALCDRLEQQTSDQLEAHETLVDTLLVTLTQSENATELADNWARLAAHFDTLFTTEQSIDKLKQTILQLAVMGRLVEQDAGDEPASDLLDKLKNRRMQLFADKKTRAAGKIKPVTSEGQPFQLPTGWAWCRFEQLIDPQFTISYGVLVPGADTTDGVPLIRVADLSLSPQQVLPEKRISPDVEAKHAKTRLIGGEILLCVVGSIGKIGIAPRSWAGANIARAICRLMPSPLISKDFLLLLLQTDFMQEKFGADTRTLAQPTLNIGLIKVAETPLPPVAEQHRIVQKVDELTTLCDQLKERLSEASATRCQLAETIVEQGLSA